jgi:hypothetical protein
MPIKDPTIYPPYWKQFSEYIRFDRAGNKCEECDVENGSVGVRDSKGRWWPEDVIHGLNSDVGADLFGADFDFKMMRIVLTVAHLDNEGGVCDCKARTGLKCANPAHVKALCQRCHLRIDLPKHIANRRASIAANKDAARGLFADVV